MQPIGYLVQQHGVRLSRPVKAYDRWVKRIPDMYRVHVLEEKKTNLSPENDPYCLATVKHFRSLVPMAQEVHKPIFELTPADRAIGSHAAAVQDAYSDYDILARKILDRIKTAEQVTEQVRRILDCLAKEPLGAREIMKKLGLRHRPTFLYDYLQPALNAEFIEMTQPQSPKSPTQKYRLTASGKAMAREGK